MIDGAVLLADTRRLAGRLVNDLRERTDSHDESRVHVEGVFGQAVAAGRTNKTFEEWREDLLAQVAAGWVLGCVFVRFCEDNGLYDVPLLSGPGERLGLARDHRSAFFAREPAADDRDWLREVFGRYAELPGVSGIFGERNPLWQLSPGQDGAKALVELWWSFDDEGRVLRHDFTDETLDTRFLGDLYQDLSEHARKQFALLQTPDFVEAFILDRTLDPAIETFGLAGTRMIDPTCGSGHFLLGAFDRLLERWRQVEPATDVRELAQRALSAVNGIDINSFAVAIARFRLLVAALKASGIRRLSDAPDFRINVATGDSLLHGTRPGQLLSGTEGFSATLRHHYPTEDSDQAERILQADSYSCVVGNPPYVTVKDGALNAAYRTLYATCHRQYSLGVPFTERFFQLAARGNASAAAGYIGMITTNSFMKREFGTKLVEAYLPTVDLTHVIDTSGAYIPGHGTPTVILFGRDRRPQGLALRAVLSIRGEPGAPENPADGLVWNAITEQVDKPGSESEFVSVEDVSRDRFGKHPWSLHGGAAPAVNERLQRAGISVLNEIVRLIGYTAQTNADDAFVMERRSQLRRGVPPEHIRPWLVGEVVRDWTLGDFDWVVYPYDEHLCSLRSQAELSEVLDVLWPLRTTLWARRTFAKKSYRDEERPWYEWHQIALDRVGSPSLVFPYVATHAHFVLDRVGHPTNSVCPFIKLPDGTSEDEHLELLGLLNSSSATFWMKQVFQSKGNGGIGGGIGDEAWEPRYASDSTKLKQFPLPDGRPLVWSCALDEAAQRVGEVLPASVADRIAPTRSVLDEAAVAMTALRRRMVALQEELDWNCYHLYELTNEELTFPLDELPPLQKGERAFEIALARKIAAGEVVSSWFERHGSTPLTDLPEHWSDAYRELVERRLQLMRSDRAIGLLERPEYKRRWNWTELADLERAAQRVWLLDQIEALLSDGEAEPELTTVARLADQLWRDPDARAVAEDLEGVGADPVSVVGQLVASAGVPYVAALRLKESGLVKRRAWERTWALQRVEDALDARGSLPTDHAEHLDASGLAVAKRVAGVDRIAAPPKYTPSDFREQTSWRLRGKFDVAKERFVLYSGTRLGADTSTVVGWAGWDHLQQLRALAGLYTARKQDGAEVGELTPMLAGMMELLPWVLQWHDEPDPVFGDRMGQYFTGFFDTERSALGLTVDDLAGWRP